MAAALANYATGATEPLDRFGYSLVDSSQAAAVLERSLWRHALLAWLAVPALVALEAGCLSMRVTCAEGYPDWTLALLLALQLHHVAAESSAWYAVKSLTTAQDHIVMRQLGVFRARKLRLLLGMLAEMSLYTDLTFVLLARSCDSNLTARWVETWLQVPLAGHHLAAAVEQLRLWGVAALLAGFNVLMFGIGGLGRMAVELGAGLVRPSPPAPSGAGSSDEHDEHDVDGRAGGEAFFVWARAAEVAFMPSVATFCAEMGAQRRFVYSEHGDTRLAAKARKELLLGRGSKENVMLQEQVVLEHWERVDASERRYFLGTLLGRVLIGAAVQLWIQTSYFALTFGDTGSKAKYKVMVGIALASIQLITRGLEAPLRLGIAGLLLVACIFAFLCCAAAKVIFAFRCPDHLWNLTTGCVHSTIAAA